MKLKLKVLRLVIHMLLGGRCRYPNQKYFVVYRDGAFCAEDTVTIIGRISKLEVYHDT